MSRWRRIGKGALLGAGLGPGGAVAGALGGYLYDRNSKPRQTPGMDEERQEALLSARTDALETQRQRQDDLVGSYQQNYQQMQQAIPAGESAIRANIARRMASTMSSVPVGSGAGLAAAGQSGYDADMASAMFGMGAAQQIGQARTDAAQAAYEASLPESRVVTSEEQAQQIMQDFEMELANAMAEADRWYGSSKSAYWSYINGIIANEPDPAIRERMMARARQRV